MKAFKIILIVLIGFIVLTAGGLFIFVKTVDLNKYIPAITAKLSAQLKRDVTVKGADLKFSFTQGTTLDVSGFALADDPKFNQESLISIEHILLGIDLKALLFKQEILVSKVAIQNPRIYILKDQQGKMNLETLSVGSGTAPAPGESENSASRIPKQEQKLPVFLVSDFTIEDGFLVYMDHSQNPSVALAVSKLDIHVSDFSLINPFTFTLDASVLSHHQNTHMTGTARINLPSMQARIDDLIFTTDLSLLDLDQLYKAVPQLTAAGLEQPPHGQLQILVRQLIAGTMGVPVLNMTGELTDGRVEVRQVLKPIEGLNVKFDANDNRIDLHQLSMRIGAGTIEGSGTVRDYRTLQNYTFNLDVVGLELSEVLSPKTLPVELHGRVEAKTKLEGQGFSAEAIPTLSGEGTMDLQNGMLANTNLLELILQKIPLLSQASGLIEQAVPQEVRAKVAKDNTTIERLNAVFKISDQKVYVNDAEIKADFLWLKAAGSVGFDQMMNLNVSCYLDSDLSKSIIEGREELSGLLDSQGRIFLPGTLTGKPPKIVFLPDMEYLGKKVLIHEGKAQLKKALEKNPELKGVLDVILPSGRTPARDGTSTNTQTPQDSQNPEGEMIDNIFKIFAE